MTPADVKSLRTSLGLTQEEFARLLGLAGKSHVSYLESGERKPSGLLVTVLLLLRDDPTLLDRLKKIQEIRANMVDTVNPTG